MQSIARQHSGAARRHPREAKRLTVLLLAAFASTAVAANQPTFTFALPGVSFGPLAIDAQGNGGRNSSANPAKPGDFITLYGTGGGMTNPAGVTGASWPESNSYPLLALQPTVTIGGENATVLYAGASPLSSSGVFQINVLAPANLAASPAALLVMKIGNATSAPIPVAIQ